MTDDQGGNVEKEIIPPKNSRKSGGKRIGSYLVFESDLLFSSKTVSD